MFTGLFILDCLIVRCINYSMTAFLTVFLPKNQYLTPISFIVNLYSLTLDIIVPLKKCSNSPQQLTYHQHGLLR